MSRSKAVAGPRGRRDDRPRVLRAKSRRSDRQLHRTAVHPALNGFLAAGSAVLSTFGVLLVVIALGWVFAADHTSLRGMFAFTVDVWLAAHLLPVEVGEMTWWFPPLLLTAAIVASGYWTTREAVKRGIPTSRAATRDFWLAMIGSYAAVATLLAAISATAATGVPLLLTPFAVAAVFGVGAALGMTRATRSQKAYLRRVPTRVRAEFKAAIIGVAVLLAGGVAVFSAAVVLAGDRIAESLAEVQPGFSGTALIILLSLVYLPTVLIWAASFALGAGFAVGTDTVVSPWAVQMGEVPAVPALTAIPTTHSWWYLIAAVLPVLGALAARRALPLGPIALLSNRRAGVLSLLRTAGFAAATMGLLALLADGGIGGRLAQLGPSPLLTTAATGAWFVVVFTLVEGWQAVWQRVRSRRGARGAADESDDVEALTDDLAGSDHG